MQLATGGNMLNFGLWNQKTTDPIEAQRELCTVVGNLAELDSAKILIDIGSGFSAPAMQWRSRYDSLHITCVNINFHQLKTPTIENGVSRVNSTSTTLPFVNRCADRIIALESAQHFKPLARFIRESRRVLNKDGILVMAIPVTTDESLTSFMKLGILSFTWSSEHYRLDNIKSEILRAGFKISEIQKIGKNVYEPLADYYIKNREVLRNKILKEYPSYLENILFKSLLKMKDASQKGFIDYVLIKCGISKV
jgi:cyclopropane fatty-acyl-phospholipid synthase-like methyltransferase